MKRECFNDTLPDYNASATEYTHEEAIYRDVTFYLMQIVTPFILTFGIFGNILNLMVLTREKMRRSLTKMEKSAHMGLIALAASDLMFCLLALLFIVLPNPVYYRERSSMLYYHWLGGPAISVFIVTSTWLIVAMAGERYVAVCHPFRARNIISLRRSRIMIVTIFVVCMAFSLPLFFEREIQEMKCVNNSTLFEIETRPSFKPFSSIRRIIWSVVTDFIPCAALVYFNTCLIWQIRLAKKLRHDMTLTKKTDKKCWQKSTDTEDSKLINAVNTSSEGCHKKAQCKQSTTTMTKRQPDSAFDSVTATLVAVVILFLILVSPSEILKFIWSRQPRQGENFAIKIVKSVTNFMQAVNFSINFVLYCAVNKSFRQTLEKLFCFCNKRLDIQIKITKVQSKQKSHGKSMA